MIKTIYKNKWLRLLSIILLILLIFVYRIISRNVLKVGNIKIEIEQCRVQIHSEMSEEQREEVNSNVDDFAFLTYSFYATNESDDIKISSMDVIPVFSDEMKENVYWYSHSDMLMMLRSV